MTGKVVGYVRVSTDLQALKGQSIGVQEERIRAYAKANGLTVDQIYSDGGASGCNTNREALSDLRKNIDDITTVIVYKFDRISRSVVDLYQLLEEFESNNVSFRSVCEGVDTGSAVGRFIMSVLASLAQMERELIAERTRDTLASKKDRGEHCGRIPFGYRFNDNKVLEKDPKQQKDIKNIKRLHRQGYSIRDISTKFSISKSTVHSIINTHLKSRNSKYLNGLPHSPVR